MFRILACLVALAPVALRAQGAALNLADSNVAAIARLADASVQMIESGDLDRLADFYSPAAVYLAEGEPAIDRDVGRAVVKRWRRLLGPNRARVSMRIEDIDVSGDLAYDRVSYTIRLSPRLAPNIPGQARVPGENVRSMRALEILRREDGVWKYYRVMISGSEE